MFLYNSKFNLTAKSLVTNSVVKTRLHCTLFYQLPSSYLYRNNCPTNRGDVRDRPMKQLSFIGDFENKVDPPDLESIILIFICGPYFINDNLFH